MLVLASYKKLRGGDLSRDFTLSRSEILDEDACDQKLALLRQLLAARGNRAALDIISRIPFQFVSAFNEDHETFHVLHASTNVAAYEHLRQLFAADREPFETLRQTLTDDCDIYVGFIVAELAPKGSEENPSSTVALEQAIAEMKKLMIAIGRRERSLKDESTAKDYTRLRKELLKYRTIAQPPPLVADCPDEWSLWRQLSKADGTYAGRSAIVSEQFEAAYANVLAGEAPVDLSTFFSTRGLLLGGEIGQGGFGIVYKAQHSLLLGNRAIKIFQPRFFESNSTALLRFTREASLLERVAHPRIVRFFDAGIAPTGTPFLVTAFVEGRSVESILRGDGVLPLQEAIELMHQVLEGLAAAHAHGIAHRDVKPSNVMWHQGIATIPDLGSAGFVDDFVTTRLTRTAQGTPGYLAPEQIENPLVVDVRSDFFAAGQMFHQLVTGKLVQPANLGHYLGGIPNGGNVHAFLSRAIAPLDHRYPDAATMDAALLAVSSKKVNSTSKSDFETAPASSFLVEEADIRSTLGLDNRWTVSEQWLQWARAQLSAPVGSRGVAVRLVRLAATWLDANGREWIDRDELLGLGQVVFGLLENIPTENLTAETKAALTDAVSKGWLREEAYDDWRPGMAPGSGMRDHYKLTPLGKKIIADVGYQPLPTGASPTRAY